LPYKGATPKKPINWAVGITQEYRVLIVEDEGIVREYLRVCLEDCGYVVMAAASCREAVALSTVLERLDLLLTDVHLESMSGVDLADELAKKYANLRVLLISGDTCQPPTAGLRAQFLSKPFTPEALTTRVQAMLAT
jgi:CheY-like chemotaxis protein